MCARSQREREREREVAKKSVWMFNECLHESSLSSSASSANEKRLFHIFSFFQPLRLFTFFTCEKAFRPKWPRPSSCEAKSDTSQIYSFQSGESVSGNSPTQTPKRARFSFSLSLGSNHKQRREEGTERSLSLSLSMASSSLLSFSASSALAGSSPVSRSGRGGRRRSAKKRTTITPPNATTRDANINEEEKKTSASDQRSDKPNKSKMWGSNSSSSSSMSANIRAIRTFAGNARTMLVASSNGSTTTPPSGKSNSLKNNNNNNNNNKRLNAMSVEESERDGEMAREEETTREKGMAFIAKIANGSIMPSSLNSSLSSNSSKKLVENEEEATKATSSNSGSNEKGKQIIGRDNVRIATSENDFEVVANLRATAFYDDLTERQALPFPPRFTPTFHREFAQRERKALAERVVRPTSACAKCVCLVADDSGEHLVVERLRNSSSAVIGCLDVSIRHNPRSNSTRYQSAVATDANASDSINRYSNGPKTETFVYVDNVAVARRARRRGAAKALLEAASNEAISWGAREMFTHVHCENTAARRLYHAHGFRACVPDIEETSSTEQGEDGLATTTTSINNNGNRFGRLAGLVMIRAPLPLKRNNEDLPPSESCDCGFEMIEEIDECICGKSGCKDPSKRLISL